jgi:predicted nucleotidyltransferase
MTTIETGTQSLLKEIATEFATLPEVTAVVLAGSRMDEFSDDRSDIDLYVYAETEPPETWRTRLGQKFGEHLRIGNRFWEPGDEWALSRTGTVVDIMYRSPEWIEEQLDRVWIRHQASVGYSTCFVYNVLHSRPLYDRDGWFASLQAKAAQPYPAQLRRAILARNHPILRSMLSSYTHQISLAVERDDRVSINHRVSALLASYFDILFAVNCLPHPGEKRLVAFVLANCPKRPANFQKQINELVSAVASPDKSNMFRSINDLLDGLDALLATEGLNEFSAQSSSKNSR